MTQHNSKFVAKNVTPYNTGKVLIGGLYIPKPVPRVMSRDEAKIQRALLGHRSTIYDAIEDARDVLAVRPLRRAINFFKAVTVWK